MHVRGGGPRTADAFCSMVQRVFESIESAAFKSVLQEVANLDSADSVVGVLRQVGPCCAVSLAGGAACDHRGFPLPAWCHSCEPSRGA